jgi:hypothetical protein
MKSIHRLSMLAIAAAMAACGGGNSGSSAAGTGTLRVAMTDAPACGYDAVNVTVTQVRIHRSESAEDGDASWSDIAVTPRKINLLDLQNGVLAELGDIKLEEGRYSQIRLVLAPEAADAGLANSLVLTADATKAEIPLRTPSAQQSGLKLVHGFDIAADETRTLVLDFDACRSVVKAGNSGNYNLKPVISVIQLASAGKLEIGGTLGTAGADAVVSAQVTDANGMPVIVRSTTADADGDYMLSPIPANEASTYTVVVTKAGYETLVVANVPASAGNLTTLPALTMTPTDETAVGGTVVVPDALAGNTAFVRAIQTVPSSPGLAVEIASSPVATDTRTYLMALPEGPVRLAPYTDSTLTFADTATPPSYTLEAAISDTDVPPQTATITLEPASTALTQDFDFVTP